ncbi:MAG: pyruvate ferredoxin oxidoreductase [Nitrososphaeria archaeon]|nr:pyruvate ferredoxin oxidoreductase [Nitrososphaeria archaeon]NIN53402.1 pyruvate ferredoxin oxidoreductase [Nitrososphaeria archaeon]NIQ33914.1 pyruvate ferredoxin oxidoreductase [Nitrososphaeria archaeon]
MSRIIGLTGDEAVAYAAKQSNVDVVAAYPITPQTIMVERYSDYVADGEVGSEFICVESEHSAMSACVGASLAGARVFTATASQGLALMHEMLYIASSSRCPIVMGVANRALSAPINIHCDHSDVMGSRDCGWIILFSENAQEAYDNTIQAFKIAEDPDILLPVMVCLDGFIISHSMEGVNALDDEVVHRFLPLKGKIHPYAVDPEKPVSIGLLALPEYYFGFKLQHDEAIKRSLEKIEEVGQAYKEISGRSYGHLEEYMMEDAETALLCMGSTAGTARTVVDKLRGEGEAVGVIKLRTYRPFPTDEIIEAAENLKSLAVMDRASSLGAPGGALYSDVRAVFYDRKPRPKVFDIVYGLGGIDITPTDLESIFKRALRVAETGVVEESVTFVGVK